MHGSRVAIIVHWGEAKPSVRVAGQVRAAFDEVVVVANDGQTQPQALPAGVIWVVSTNVGYAGGCELGVSLRPDAEAYAFLNNDVHITAAACTELMEALTGDPRLAVVGPTLVHADGRLQSGAGTWSPVVCAPLVRNPAVGLQRCDWVTGAAFFCSGRAVREVGFDVSFFLGQEDADFCDRARASGWDIAVAGEVTATHEGGTTISGARWVYYSLRNWLWFVRRRRSLLRVVLLTLYALTALLPRVMAADVLKRRSPLHTRLLLHALKDGLGPMPPPDRHWEDEPRPARWMSW